jgi:pectate lyase
MPEWDQKDLEMRSNKTIIGLGTDATFIGCLRSNQGDLPGNSNIIVRNLTITNPTGNGSEADCMIIDEQSENIWLDHCTFFDSPDELLSVKDGSDWVTVSWCKFYYTDTESITSRKAILIGSNDYKDDVDTGKLHVTLHHNWFAPLTKDRQPRVRFGRIHCFNNYHNSPDSRCLLYDYESETLVEGNYYKEVSSPWSPDRNRKGRRGGLVFTRDNVFGNLENTPRQKKDILTAEENGLNPPPYSYNLDPAKDVPALVTAGAGAGNGCFRSLTKRR